MDTGNLCHAAKLPYRPSVLSKSTQLLSLYELERVFGVTSMDLTLVRLDQHFSNSLCWLSTLVVTPLLLTKCVHKCTNSIR